MTSDLTAPAFDLADQAIRQTERDLYDLADRFLPGAGLGSYSLPEDLRFIIARGEGSRLQSVGGRWYIDYVGGAGALILGHAFPTVVEAVREQATKGIHYFGTLNEAAIRLSEEIVAAVPCAEKISYATTGSEATFYAMRIARAYTGRSKVLKCEGAYHGNHDYSNFSVSPTELAEYPVGRPDTGGIPDGVSDSVLIVPYNDLDTISRVMKEHQDDLAAIIVEPAQRILFPEDGFLRQLRELCTEYDILLIFDEVVTGFRLAYGGAQEYFGVTPDLASYGKIIGGGGPVACVAGPAELMDHADPHNRGNDDYAYVNGTLHGNPLGCAAGLATLEELRTPGFYHRLNARGEQLRSESQKLLDDHGLPAKAIGDASLWQIVFTDREPRRHSDMMTADMERSRELDRLQMANGLYVLPGVRRFVSSAHTDNDVEETLTALQAACHALT